MTPVNLCGRMYIELRFELKGLIPMKKYTNVKELNKAVATMKPDTMCVDVHNGFTYPLSECQYYNPKTGKFWSDLFTEWEKCAIITKGTIKFYGFNDPVPDIELSKQMGKMFLPC